MDHLFLWNTGSVLIDGELVLAVYWVDFGLLELPQRLQGQGDTIAEFHVLSHEFGYDWTLAVVQC